MRFQGFLRLQILTLFLATGLAAQSAPAPPVSPAPPKSPIQTVEEDLRAFLQKRQVPGLSIAVGRHGRQVWVEAFGVADLDGKTPLTTDAVFPLGSTSKALTSLALGKLVEDKKLDLDAPIQTYVPYFPLALHCL